MTLQAAPTFKHVGSFCIILFFALFRPAAIWPEIPVSTAPLAVLAAWLLLFYKIHKTIGYRTFLHQHQTLLLLAAGYFALCGASLIANYHRYPDMSSFVRWGLTFPIIQSAIVACGFLFSLPQNTKGPSISSTSGSSLAIFAIAAGIPAITLWQILDHDSAYRLYQYSIAGDIGAAEHIRRSIFATSTDLGAACAIISIAALIGLIDSLQARHWLWAAGALLTLALSAISGTVSGSRVFFLSFGAGIFTLLILTLRGRPTVLLLSIVALTAISILALQFAPANVSAKLGKITPIFLVVGIGLPLDTRSLSITVDQTVLGERSSLWLRAMEQIGENPHLGISNGGYRLLNESLGESPINNVHNVLLQLGVDTGVGGLGLGLVLIALLVRLVQKTAVLAIFVTALSGLLVDNFTDHSLAWIALTTFALANGAKPRLGDLGTLVQSNRVNNALTIIIGVIVIGILIRHKALEKSYQSQSIAHQINTTRDYLWGDYWNDAPIFLSKELSETMGHARAEGASRLYTEIPVDRACSYAYPGGQLLHLTSESINPLLHEPTVMGDQWSRTKFENNDCLADATNLASIGDWISNYDYYSPSTARFSDAKQIRMITDYVSFFSPIFSARKPQTVHITAVGKELEGISPTLIVTYLDAKTGDTITELAFRVGREERRISIPMAGTKSGRAYLRLRLRDWQSKSSTQRQEVHITAFEVRLAGPD